MSENKKSIDYTSIIKAFFAKMTRNQSFIIGVVISIMIFTHFSVDKVVKAFKEYNDCNKANEMVNVSNKQIEKMANNEIRLKNVIDSIQQVHDAEKSALASRNKMEISRELDRVKYNMNNVSDITFWGKHNGGKVMNETSEIYFEVYLSTDFNIESRYSNKVLMPKGHDVLCQELLESNYKYISSFTQEPEIYVSKTKQYFRLNNSKSLIGALIRNKGTDWYFVTISFDVENPTDHNGDLFHTIRTLKTYINKRIL